MEKEKLIEEIEKLSVVELAELVKAMEEKFGISAALPSAAGAAAGPAPRPSGARSARRGNPWYRRTIPSGARERPPGRRNAKCGCKVRLGLARMARGCWRGVWRSCGYPMRLLGCGIGTVEGGT
ncbi:MAG: hypothetical protein HYW52_01535 [Gemmatimonadetes bacterium]|nr:hypothetical protein [Gemmatimonadota bacterium]